MLLSLLDDISSSVTSEVTQTDISLVDRGLGRSYSPILPFMKFPIKKMSFLSLTGKPSFDFHIGSSREKHCYKMLDLLFMGQNATSRLNSTQK